MSTPILQAENLTKIYRSADKELTVLDNVSFRVDEGMKRIRYPHSIMLIDGYFSNTMVCRVSTGCLYINNRVHGCKLEFDL